MPVEFRLLGDVQAMLDGQPLEIGHARQLCVLAALLVDANRCVTADQLIDRVWGVDHPHRPRNVLAAYVSRLRHALGRAEDVEIGRGPGGYVLKADALAIDVHRFRRLVSAARATESTAEAATKFDAALDLWSGEPLAQLDTPWTNEVRTALAAERQSAQLDRNDVYLRIGRHGELIADLAASLRADPLDERLAGQLMSALYRSGRQADALETYRQMRERLVEELGVDPGVHLRKVHQQILDGAPPDTPAVPPQPAITAQPRLPRSTTSFIGRDQELDTVIAAARAGQLVTLTGFGGVGKTRLALEVAERGQGALENGAWLCELAPLEVGAGIGHALAVTWGLQPRQAQAIEETVIEHLRSRELLLVLDNCEHVLAAAAQMVDRIIRECPRITVLATSREPLGVAGERVVPVPPLSDIDAGELFAARAKASRPDFDADREPVGAVAEICRRLDGIPLAIELAAARMRAMSSLDVARRLDRLRLLSGGARGAHPRQHSVAATIDWSYRLLAETEQQLFERLSVFAGGFDLEVVHGVCGQDGASEDDTLELLTSLVDKSMVTIEGGTPTRYGMLEMLRAYGRDRLLENGLQDDVASRHAVYFTDLLECAAAGMRGPDEKAWSERITPDAATTHTAPDYDNLRTAFERAIAVNNIDLALRLVTSLNETMHMRVGVPTVGWVGQVIELADPDHPLFAEAVGVAARAAWAVGEFSRARSLAGLADGRVPGPDASIASYPADVLADVCLCEGDSAAALAHYDGELEYTRHAAHPLRLLWILYSITLCHTWLRKPEAGLPAALEAVQVADATANPTARSMALCALGRALAESDPDRALTMLDQAAKLAAPVQNGWLLGLAWTESAAIRAVHGDPAATARMFVEVLDHWERGAPGSGPHQLLTLRYVAPLFVRLGADADALEVHRALVASGLTSPLDATQLARLGATDRAALSGVEALALARSSLQRYC